MKTNTIQGLKLETECRGLKKQGKTVRDIARIMTDKHHVSITASAVFRFLQKDEPKQTAAPPIKLMKINLKIPENAQYTTLW